MGDPTRDAIAKPASEHLLRSRRFAPLFWCQFFSAFNDSYIKAALGFILLYRLAAGQSQMLIQIATAIFIAPSFVLSALGGQWADRHDKAVVAQRLKLVEFVGVAIAAAGFLLPSLPLLFVALALFGVLSALFGPVKYGILPDLLPRERLAAGNALVEGATFIAIIAGTFVAALSSGEGRNNPIWFVVLTLVFAAISYGASRFIPRVGEGAPHLTVDRNVLRSTGELMRELWRDARLWRGGIVVSLFWLVGAISFGLLAPIVKTLLGGTEIVVSLYSAVFAVGIALGSGLASWLVGGRILTLPAPIAAVVIGLSCLDLAWTLHGAGSQVSAGAGFGVAAFLAQPHAWRLAVDMLVLTMAGGLFIVPSFAAVQAWAPADRRARVIAAVNVLSALFIAGGTVAVALVIQVLHLSISAIFALLGVGAFAAAVWIFRTLPTNPLRDLSAMLFRIVYRLEVRGLENLAAAGPKAIIALNHVSLLDAPLAFTVLDQDPVFAIDSGWAKKWWMKPLVGYLNALPLDPTRPLATRLLIQAVRNGATLVIFPEGRITRTGSLMKVYDGSGLIAAKTGVPVVPVRIEGADATRFSYLTNAQVRRPWFKKITVTVMPPQRIILPDELTGRARRQAAGAALYSIMSRMIFATTPTDRTVHQALIDAAEAYGPNHHAFEDPVSGPMTYKRALIGARVLGAKLADLAPIGGTVGLMLPTSVGCLVSLMGLMSAGRVAAMVNFSAGAANIRSAGTAAGFDTIVTSRAFIEKGKLDKLVAELARSFRIVYLEDIRATVGRRDKIEGLLGWRKPLVARRGDNPAAVLFTSGSEGTPKGVVLSHRNMLSNAAQARAVAHFGRDDTMFNTLPMFHAFGLTIGTVVPMVFGVKVYLYPSPLHYRIIPELIYGSNATILLGTDTFLAGYARAANPYDFRSLRCLWAGAEPVKESTRAVYMEKFGLRVLEGYGITEMGPLLSVNTEMFNKNGSVGRLAPGREVRLEPVDGIDEGGRLVVRGPNTMLGYLKDDRPGVLVPPAEGWHDTGDIVAIDGRGFISIKGRAKRFAKIGGEMISLAQIEALAADLWPDAVSAAATLPDARKGERIVLITQREGASRGEFASFAKKRGASDLVVPAEVATVATIPLLGSGKVDFAGVKRLIEERGSAEPHAEEPDEERDEATAAA